MLVDVKVPVLAESIAEATLINWHKTVGDTVKHGDNLVDIETDKVTLEVAALNDGMLSEIIKGNGATVQSNEVIAHIDTVVAVAKSEQVDDAPEQASLLDSVAETDASPKLSPAVRTLIDEHQLDIEHIPTKSEDNRITKENIIHFIEDDGDKSDPVATAAESKPADDAVDTVEFDAPEMPDDAVDAVEFDAPEMPDDAVDTVEFDAPEMPDDAVDTVEFDAPEMPDDAVDAVEIDAPEMPDDAVDAVEIDAPEMPDDAVGAVEIDAPEPEDDAVGAVEIDTLEPAVHAVAAAPTDAAPESGDAVTQRTEEKVPMTRLRKRAAERLLTAQHENAILTTFNEINMQAVMAIRARCREEFESAHGVKLGFMSFFTKSVVESLKKFPLINASVDGDNIVYHGYFDIGIAVSAPQGLVVPVIRDADLLSLAEIEMKIREYGEKARDRKLTLDELIGGTFTITNGGVFGSLVSTPIINPPQSAILGMHKIQDRPVVEDGQVVIRPMMYLALSYDHRIIDGREAVQYLVSIKNQLEDPARLLLQL